jgi:hypothetical protein
MHSSMCVLIRQQDALQLLKLPALSKHCLS